MPYLGLLSKALPLNIIPFRTHARYPSHTLHIRFDPTDGRKIPCGDVLDRFKRLNNGLWIRGRPGRFVKHYRKEDDEIRASYRHETCTQIESQLIEKTMNRFWVRPKYYLEDPYAPYHVRHGLKTPRVNFENKMHRERPKVLLEDTVADAHFYDH